MSKDQIQIPMNKSYDFRQQHQIKQKNAIKLDINNNFPEMDDPTFFEGENGGAGGHQSKIIFNSRQIRRMSNNYIKGGNHGQNGPPPSQQQHVSPDTILLQQNQKANAQIIKLTNNRKITPVNSAKPMSPVHNQQTIPGGGITSDILEGQMIKKQSFFTHNNSPIA